MKCVERGEERVGLPYGSWNLVLYQSLLHPNAGNYSSQHSRVCEQEIACYLLQLPYLPFAWGRTSTVIAILSLRQLVTACSFHLILLVNLAMATSANYGKKSLLPNKCLIKKKKKFYFTLLYKYPQVILNVALLPGTRKIWDKRIPMTGLTFQELAV